MERCCENCSEYQKEAYWDEYFKIMDERCQCDHPCSDDYRFKCDKDNNYSWFKPKEE